MTSIDDIIDSFDAISSAQNQQPDKPILVFIDEINATIARNNVYAHFLSPMWDGVFKRGAMTFTLKPCVWVFAGTESLKDIEKEVKGSDFTSRINGPKLKIDIEDSEKNKKAIIGLKKTEQVYIGISVLKRKHPDVSKIQKGIFSFFYNIKPKYGARSIDYITDKFKFISHGKIINKNIPGYNEIIEQINIYDKSAKEKSDEEKKLKYKELIMDCNKEEDEIDIES